MAGNDGLAVGIKSDGEEAIVLVFLGDEKGRGGGQEGEKGDERFELHLERFVKQIEGVKKGVYCLGKK